MKEGKPTVGTVELAQLVEKPRQTINLWITTGKLPATKDEERVGSPIYVIDPDEAADFLEGKAKHLHNEANVLETAAISLRQMSIAKEPLLNGSLETPEKADQGSVD